MEHAALITGIQSPLSRSLVNRLVKKDLPVIVCLEKQDDEMLYPDHDNKKLILRQTDLRSAIAVHSLYLDLKNQGLHPAQIFVTHSILARSDTFETLQTREIESRIDREIKGITFFLRETLGYFERSAHSGGLNIVLQNTGPDIPSVMDSLVSGSLESAANALFTYYRLENLEVRGFTSRDAHADEYADFIGETLDEGKPPARWYQYRGKGRKLPIFGSMR